MHPEVGLSDHGHGGEVEDLEIVFFANEDVEHAGRVAEEILDPIGISFVLYFYFLGFAMFFYFLEIRH